MTDATEISANPTAAIEPRAAVIRMVAAAEYFKSAGELPSWACGELQSWSRRGTAAPSAARRS